MDGIIPFSLRLTVGQSTQSADLYPGYDYSQIVGVTYTWFREDDSTPSQPMAPITGMAMIVRRGVTYGVVNEIEDLWNSFNDIVATGFASPGDVHQERGDLSNDNYCAQHLRITVQSLIAGSGMPEIHRCVGYILLQEAKKLSSNERIRLQQCCGPVV